MKESKVSLTTYGQLNNVPEVVYMQHLMGFEGVIVDLVQEISDAVSDFTHAANNEGEEESVFGGEETMQRKTPICVFSAFCQYHVAHRNRTDGNDQLVMRVESSI